MNLRDRLAMTVFADYTEVMYQTLVDFNKKEIPNLLNILMDISNTFLFYNSYVIANCYFCPFFPSV